jgi:hypothetical protein
MVGKVLQPRLHTIIIFTGDKDKPVRAADLSGKFFKHGGRLTLWVLLVHAVQHRQSDCFGIDQFDVLAARPKTVDDEPRKPNAHPVGAIGAVEHENAMAHALPPIRWFRSERPGKPIIGRATARDLGEGKVASQDKGTAR